VKNHVANLSWTQKNRKRQGGESKPGGHSPLLYVARKKERPEKDGRERGRQAPNFKSVGGGGGLGVKDGRRSQEIQSASERTRAIPPLNTFKGSRGGSGKKRFPQRLCLLPSLLGTSAVMIMSKR